MITCPNIPFYLVLIYKFGMGFSPDSLPGYAPERRCPTLLPLGKEDSWRWEGVAYIGFSFLMEGLSGTTGFITNISRCGRWPYSLTLAVNLLDSVLLSKVEPFSGTILNNQIGFFLVRLVLFYWTSIVQRRMLCANTQMHCLIFKNSANFWSAVVTLANFFR